MSFHLLSLSLELLAALSVYFLARRLLPKSGPGPFLATLVFIVHPAGYQAVSWVAAGGDLLATICGIQALHAVLGSHRQAKPALLRAGLWLALALASKLSAWMFVPLVAWVGVRRLGWRASFSLRGAIRGFGFILPISLMAGLRWCYTGSFGSRYSGGTTIDFSMLHTLLGEFPRLLRHVAAPWNLEPQAESQAALVWAAFRALQLPWTLTWVPLAAALGLGLLANPRATLRVLVASLLAFLLLAPGPLFLLVQSTEISRSLYSLNLPIALVFGAGLGAWLSRGSWHFLAWIVLGAQLVISADALVHRARVEIRAGKLVTARLEALDKLYKRRGPDQAVVVIEDQKFAGWAGLPVLGPLVRMAMQPPFTSVEHELDFVFRKEQLFSNPEPLRTRSAVTVLSSGWEGYETLAELPALPSHGVRLERDDRGDWIPAEPLPCRGFEGVSFRLRDGGRRQLFLRVVGEGVERKGWIEAAPGRVMHCGIEPNLAWLLGGRARRLEIREASGAPVSLRSVPDLLFALPSLEISGPKDGLKVDLGTPQLFGITVPWGSGRVRLEFSVLFHGLGFDMVYEREVTKPGELQWSLRKEELVRASFPELSWGALPALFESYGRPRGIPFLELRWKASALSRDGSWVVARSPSRTLSLLPPR